MKTIIEYLETLPEPYRTQAIENCKVFPDTRNDRAESTAAAIIKAFDWSETKQGYGYWQRYWYSLTL